VCEFLRLAIRHHFTISEARLHFRRVPLCAAFLAHYGQFIQFYFALWRILQILIFILEMSLF
jgi:hypothetical protein